MFAGVDIGRVTVSEPSKVSMGLGVKPVILYQIRTAYLPDAMVKRRYNDFLWLYNSLIQQYPASIIPILPDKSLRPQYDEIFLETRRKKLEWFLNRISEHEELSKSTIFEVFLLANDAKLASEKSKQENGSSIYLKKKSSSPAMSAAFAWVGNQVSLLNPLELFDADKSKENAESAKSEKEKDTDAPFTQITSQLKALLSVAMKLSELSTLLTKDLTSSSLALSATGSSFSAWGKEEEDGHLGKKLSSTGESCSALALSTGVFAQRQMEGVEDPLSEILAYIASALLAFQRREAVRLEAEACAREVASFDASACASDSTFSTLPPTSSSPSSMSWLKKTPAVEGAATSSGESAGSKKNKELYAVALLKQGKVKERLEKVSTTLLSEYESFERTRLSLMKNILIHASRIQREHFLTLEESSKTFVNNVC